MPQAWSHLREEQAPASSILTGTHCTPRGHTPAHGATLRGMPCVVRPHRYETTTPCASRCAPRPRTPPRGPPLPRRLDTGAIKSPTTRIGQTDHYGCDVTH